MAKPGSSKRAPQANFDDDVNPTTARGPYSAQACNICRRKKTKCDNQRPVCGRCSKSGWEAECSWARETIVRKPRTEALFESMQKHIGALREYANYLESLLEKCHREHGGSTDTSYLRLRPKDDSDATGVENMTDCSTDQIEDTSADFGPENDSTVKELCVPTQNLKLEEEGLILAYRNTAVFRFAQVPPQASRFPAIVENPNATYVLLVDGVDDSHYNPNFDWSRHLPSNVPLDRRSHDKALDLLFKFFTPWCFRVVPALFLRDMYRALVVPRGDIPPKTLHYSPMLHDALVALGTAFLDDPNIQDFKFRRCFADTAKSYIEVECQKPHLSVVHALACLASFHSSERDQTLGFLYSGMSARMSQALGLGVDCSDWVKLGLIEESDRLDRNRTYWSTISQDVCWALNVGRDFCITSPSNSPIPVPFVDTELDQMPWCHPPAGIAPQANYISKTFAATCELLIITRHIMDVVNNLNRARTRPIVLDELISDIDIKLNTWKSSLSPEVDITIASRPTATPHRLMLHLTYWWVVILLHRPFFHRKAKPIRSTDKEIDHVKLCKRAAENIVELVTTWHALYTLRYTPITLAQIVFSAGTVYLLWGVQATSGPRVAHKELKTALDQQKLCYQYLVEIGKSWQCATNIAGILKSLIHEQLKPVLEHRQLALRLADDEGQIPPCVQRSSSATCLKRPLPTPSRKGKQRKFSRGRGQAPDAILQSRDTPNISGFQGVTPYLPAPFTSPPMQVSTSASPASPFPATPSEHLEVWGYPGASGSSISPGPSLTSSSSSLLALSDVSPEIPSQSYINHNRQPDSIVAYDPLVNLGQVYNQRCLEQQDSIYPCTELPGFLAMLDGQTLSDMPFMAPFSLMGGDESDQAMASSGFDLGSDFSGDLWPSVEPMMGEYQQCHHEDNEMTIEDIEALDFWLQQLAS